VLVEDPVNSEIHSGDSVLFDGIPEGKGLLPPGTLNALVVGRGAVEFVRDERDGDVIGPLAEQTGEGLEAGRAESGMAGRIGREVGREVVAGSTGSRPRKGVAPGRSEREPEWIALLHAPRVAVTFSGRPEAAFSLADANHRAPEVVDVLPVPGCDSGIGHGSVDGSQSIYLILMGEPLEISAGSDDLVIQPGWSSQFVGSVISPEKADCSMLLKGGISLRDVVPSVYVN